MDRILPWLVSVVLHLGVLGALVLVPVNLQTRRSPVPIQVELLEPAPPDVKPKPELPVAKPDPPARVAERPRPSPRPLPRPSRHPRPKPSPLVTPKPQPTTDATAEKVRILRQVPGYEDKSEQELAQEPLPPGVNSWEELAEIFKKLAEIKMEVPPDVGASQSPVQDVTWDHELVGNRHHLIVHAPQGQYWVQWNEGETDAEGVFYVPTHEGDGQTVRVPVEVDRQRMVDALLRPAPSPS